MYKAVVNYEPQEDDSDEYLHFEKGDILIDGEIIDDEWFRAKNVVSEKYGKIRRSCIEPFSVMTQDTRDHELIKENNGPKKKSLVHTLSDYEAQKLSSSYAKQLEEETENPILVKQKHVENDEVKMIPVEEVKVGTVLEENEGDPRPGFSPCALNGPKTSDDGYNSSSYYSGEPNETHKPLLAKPSISKQDEAGYEVPQIHLDNQEQPVESSKSANDKGKRRLLRSIFRSRSMDRGNKNAEKQTVDDVHEKYYNPPADIRNNYFLPQSRCPIVRVLLSLIAALSISFTALFVLIISLDPLLSFCISFLLFLVVFVTPVTLLNQGFLCVLALIFPSLFSTRTKIGALLLLLVLVIVGPILGIVDKVHIAASCKEVRDGVWDGELSKQSPTIIETYDFRRGSIQEECLNLLLTLNSHCVKETFKRFQRKCSANAAKDSLDEKLCAKSEFEFCRRNTTLIHSCLAKIPQPRVDTADNARTNLLYLLPLLFLFLLSDAYYYNKVYLTTKNADNVYITNRLKELDCERKHRGLTDLILPLTRIEFQRYLLRGRLVLSRLEKVDLLKWLCTLIIAGFISLCFMLLEDTFHSTLLKLQIDQCEAFYQSNTGIRYRIYIYILLAVLLFIILLQSYALRLRSIICDHFYSDMVDIRAKHLYYKILHDRHSFARHIRRKIQLRSESKRLNRRISCASMVFQTLPSRLRCLFRKLSIRHCMICDSLTYYKTVECNVGECQAHYCYECFVDAGQTCLTCKIPSSPPPTVPVPAPV